KAVFFNDGAVIFGKSSGDLKTTENKGKEEKIKLDSVAASIFEWKTKLGMLIPLSEDGDFKAGPFSGFNCYYATFNINGKNFLDRRKDSVSNMFIAFPIGVRTEYAKKDWKLGLDLEYDFVVGEDSFKLFDSVDVLDGWSNGHIFLVTRQYLKVFCRRKTCA
ncbi:MAG: hypothetical protein LE168_05275, partial [Endomicrobium sp.]|nr:hypothetical protein [Endomicrobium sp.]